MPKRKRDIFTVIESINNWFEASAQYTTSDREHEGIPSGFEPNGEAIAESKVDGWSAEDLGANGEGGSVSTVSLVASSCPDSSGQVRTRSELAGGAANCSTLEIHLELGNNEVAKPQGVPDDHGYEGRPLAGYDPASLSPTSNLVPASDTGESGGDNLAPHAFWQVLKDAGYDIWGI